VDESEAREIEEQVNEEIRKNQEIRTDIKSLDEALASGALAFFGDKYPEANVRVVTILDAVAPTGFYSKELCGGTHVARTGEIGLFKIVSEQSVAAGVRRIEAITGDEALARFRKLEALAEGFRTKFRVEEESESTLRKKGQDLTEFYERLLNDSRNKLREVTKKIALEEWYRSVESSDLTELRELRKKIALEAQAKGNSQIWLLKGIKVVASRVDDLDREQLRSIADTLRQQLGSGVVVLFSVHDGQVALITAVTKDLTDRLHAGKIIQELAKLVSGSGGGKPDLGEAGGKDTSAIKTAIAQVYPLLDRLL